MFGLPLHRWFDLHPVAGERIRKGMLVTIAPPKWYQLRPRAYVSWSGENTIHGVALDAFDVGEFTYFRGGEA